MFVAGTVNKVNSDLPAVWHRKTIALLRRPLLIALISTYQHFQVFTFI